MAEKPADQAAALRDVLAPDVLFDFGGRQARSTDALGLWPRGALDHVSAWQRTTPGRHVTHGLLDQVDALMAEPQVELLWWSGCPSHREAGELLESAVAEAGLDSASLERVQVVTDEEAAREHFVGSPTIRVNGTDSEPPADGALPPFSCGVYFHGDKRPSHLPDPERLVEVLKAATGQTARQVDEG